MSLCDTCVHNDEPWATSPCEKCRVNCEGEPFQMYEARKATQLQRMTQKIIDSLPEDSPLLPHIKEGGSDAWICLMIGMLVLPGEKMKEIAQEVLDEEKEEVE